VSEGFLHCVLTIEVDGGENDSVQLNSDGLDTGSPGWEWHLASLGASPKWLRLGEHASAEVLALAASRSKGYASVGFGPKEWTGLKDVNGIPVLVGDVFEWTGNKAFPVIRSVVHWEPSFGAFIHAWRFESGGGGNSINGETFAKMQVVGNIFDDAQCIWPAKDMRKVA
jgi:hypothetical protein